MRVYGKTLGEIFQELPWQYKIVMVVSAAFLAYAFFFLIYFLLTFGVKSVEPGPLAVNSYKGRGLLDPSIDIDAKGAVVAMAATSLVEAPNGKGGFSTQIQMLSASLPCSSWSALTPAFETQSHELLAPDGTTTLAEGNWRIETPTIVYDPEDKGREWKIYAYKYFWSDNMSLARYYSVIVHKHAPDPRGKWSDEEWLFSASADYPPSPYGDIVRNRLNALDPALADVRFYARPSALYGDGVLILSLSAFTDRETPDRTVLVASLDHGKSWKYLGTAFTANDALSQNGYTSFKGATLLRQGGTVFLAAVLGNEGTDADGTFLFAFDDIAKASLRRDEKGAPLLVRHMPLLSKEPTKTGGGFAAYLPACKSGIITSEFSGVRKSYTLFESLQKPSE